MPLVSVEYLKDHGSNKKGDKPSRKMYETTAKALAAHKVVKILDEKK